MHRAPLADEAAATAAAWDSAFDLPAAGAPMPVGEAPASVRPAGWHARAVDMEAVLDAVPDAVIGLDGEARIDFVNLAAFSVFGLDPHRLAGTPLSALLPDVDTRAAHRRADEGVFMRASGTWLARFETTARRHDGTPFPADVSLTRRESDDGTQRFTCVIRDVTEQRMAMAQLHLFSRALDCTTNGVVISDMSMPGSPLFYANPAFERITGYSVEEAIGRGCDFLQAGDRDQPAIRSLRDAIARGEATTVVLRNYRKDGALFFNELSISPVRGEDATGEGAVRYYVGVLNDVTERERTRLAIAERSARLNAVFDLSPDGFVVFDRRGRIAYTNRAFVGMTGWDPALEPEAVDLAGFDRALGALADPALPSPAGAAQAVSALRAGAAPRVDTLTLKRPQHRILARAIRCQADGESILFFRDITHESEVDRMKSEFLTTAAHELRTPMVSVYGFTELLLRRPVPEDRRRDMLETIHRQSSLLINMVNELLDLARIEARQGKDLALEPCRLDALIREATGPFALQLSPRHRLQVEVAHPDCTLRLDPEKTIRALTNVLSNALKYSPDGGTIRVETVGGTVDGLPAVAVRVSDPGIGMTSTQLARVFERFYRADPSGNIPGTGLGMCLVKEIVELQGGRVTLTSEPGAGTAASLWFPLAALPA